MGVVIQKRSEVAPPSGTSLVLTDDLKITVFWIGVLIVATKVPSKVIFACEFRAEARDLQGAIA